MLAHVLIFPTIGYFKEIEKQIVFKGDLSVLQRYLYHYLVYGSMYVIFLYCYSWVPDVYLAYFCHMNPGEFDNMYSEAMRSIYTVTWLYLRDYPFIEFAIHSIFRLDNTDDVPFHLYQFIFQQLYQHFRHAHRWLYHTFNPLSVILPPFLTDAHDPMDPVHYLDYNYPATLPIPILDSEFVAVDPPSLIIIETMPLPSPNITPLHSSSDTDSDSFDSEQSIQSISTHSSMPSLELAYVYSSASSLTNSQVSLPDLISVDAPSFPTSPPIVISPWPDLNDLIDANVSPSSYHDQYSPFSSQSSDFNPSSFYAWDFAFHVDADEDNQMETVSTPSSLRSLFYDEIPASTLSFPHAPLYCNQLGIPCVCSFCINPYAGLSRLFHIHESTPLNAPEDILNDTLTWLFT